MDKNNALSKKGASIQRDMLGESIFCECNGEFTLPDYLPEIRKIIRIDAKAIPSGKFVSASKAEFAGIVAYTIIYSDTEGELCATSLSSEYEFSCNIPLLDSIDANIIADTYVDNTVCRLIGPRKLTLRSSIKSRLHAYASNTISEIMDELPELEALTSTELSSLIKCATSDEFSLSDSVNLDGITPEMLRTNYLQAELLVREARINNSAIACRGDVILKCNYSASGSEPITLVRKIPFEQSIFLDDLHSGDSCIAYGRCNSATVSVSGNGMDGSILNFDIGAEINVECARNEEVSIVCDLYSTECELTPQYRDVVFTHSLGSDMGNYSVDATRQKLEEEAEISSIIDTKGKAEIKEISHRDEKVIVIGECRVELLTSAFVKDKNEYGSSSVIIPFKIETDLRIPGAENAAYDCHIEVVSCRGRLESGSIGADAEIFIAIRASRNVTRKVIDTMTKSDSKASPRQSNELVIVYPYKEDTLFSIAKRYGVRYAELARVNNLPESAKEHPNDASSLAGVSHLLIP